MKMNSGEINDRSGQVVDAAMKVHSKLGPGLLEGAYEACLTHELRRRGLRVQTQLAIPSSTKACLSSWRIELT